MKIGKETKNKNSRDGKKVGFKVHSPSKNMETCQLIPHDTMEKPQQRNTQKATRQIKETGKKAQRNEPHARPPTRNPAPQGQTTKRNLKSPTASTPGKPAPNIKSTVQGVKP